MNPITRKTVLESGFKSLSGKRFRRCYSGTYPLYFNLGKTGKIVRKFPTPPEGVTYTNMVIDLSDLSIQEQASLHAIEREEALGLQLTTVGALTARRWLPPNEILEVVAAEWQASKGSKEKGTEAAHEV